MEIYTVSRAVLSVVFDNAGALIYVNGWCICNLIRTK